MMTDQQISRALALAIGWKPEQIRDDGKSVAINLGPVPWPHVQWPTFDYRDPSVIWPIAERYNAFPFQLENGYWYAQPGFNNMLECSADTAAKAVALAVIAGAKQ